MSSAWLAIDGGQSATRMRASWADVDVSGAGFHHDADRIERIPAAVDALLRRIAHHPRIARVAIGHTGLPPDAADLAAVATAVLERTGATTVLLAADWVTAHIGAFAGGPGVVLSAGTGAVALGVDESGRHRRVDGHGYLFGDAGSAFAIGRGAIDLALRHLDGRVSAKEVLRAVRERYGRDVKSASWQLYASPTVVDDVARLAPAIIDLADAGDPDATVIIARAAQELATTAAAAGSLFGRRGHRLAVTGRLMARGALTDAFGAAISERDPTAEPVVPLGDPLDGAALLAESGSPLHLALIHELRSTP